MSEISVDDSIWGGADPDGYTMFEDTSRKKSDNDRSQSSFKYSNGFSHILPPTDRYNMIYMALFLAGVGFLLPYNSFIMAVDYFKVRYPNSRIVFDMSTVYIFTAFFAVLINNVLVEALTLNTRIKAGYIISVTTLLFVAICEVWWETFGLSLSVSYCINLIAVAIVAFGCTVQQSSFYGYTSMLPSRYTQAVMAGESAAGFWVSINRITTKWMLPGETSNTVLFFFASSILVGICFIINMIIRETDFVKYYIRLCQESRTKITLEPTEDSGLMDQLETGDEVKTQYGFLKLQTSPPPTDTGAGSNDVQTKYSAFSFANPVYEPTTTKRNSEAGKFVNDVDGRVRADELSGDDDGLGGTKYRVEDIVIRMRPSVSGPVYPGGGSRLWNSIKRGWWARLEVSRLIWEDMLAIGLAYFVTLCLYPGIISEINSCRYGSWLPVILMALFNSFDLLGKICSGRPIRWGRMLLPFNGLRIIAVILSLLVMVNAGPGGELEYCAMVLSIFLGITNGVFGSVPMIIAPGKVPEQHREISGNIMTLSYNMGLTAGSIAAYFLNGIIKFGDANLCPKNNSNYLPLPTTMSTISQNLATTIATTQLYNNNTTVTNIISNVTNNISSPTVLSTLSTLAVAVTTTLINTTSTARSQTTLFTPTMPLAVLNISSSFISDTSTNFINDD